MGRLTVLAHHLLIFQLSIFAVAASSFSLEEVSSVFPNQGLEDRIAFWKLVFTQFGEREVIFHDENDLRLTYHIERFTRKRDNDSAEIRSQRDHLKRTHREIKALFDDIAEYGPNSGRLNSKHRRIIEQLKKANYKISASSLRTLRDRIRYQRGIKEKFQEGLIRSGMYFERMQAIFESYGLPTEICYLPHVESSFDYRAYSKAGAAGIWQFTRGTGRNYLRINRFMDERLDPIRATDAAARLLRDNYAVLGNWPLAITSYNHGKNGMLRAKKQYGSDLPRIISHYKSRYFGFASKNFYAEFLAALEVARNYGEYFGAIELALPLEFETLRLTKGYDSSYLTSVPGLTKEVLSTYNPQLHRVFASPGRVVPSGIELRLPVGTREPLRVALQSAKPSTAGVMIAADGSTRYRVQRGDVLGDIAANFGASVRQLQRLNRLPNANRIHVGQVLLISGPTEPVSTTVEREATPANYRVRSGDTLSSIAQRFGTTVGEVTRANKIANPDQLYPGMKLQLNTANSQTTQRYKVRRGDTLAKIAQKFDTSVSSIKTANRIRNANLIQQGQELVIP